MIRNGKSQFKNVVRTLPILLLLSLIGSSLSYGQKTNTELSELDSILTIAKSLYKAEEYDKAFEKYISVSTRAYASGDWDTWYRAFTGKRKVFQEQGDFKEGLTMFKEDYKSIPDSVTYYRTMTNYHVGRFYYKLNQFHKAVPKIESTLYQLKAIAKVDTSRDLRKIISGAYINLALNYSRMGDQNSAINIAAKGIDYTDFDYNPGSFCHLLVLLGKFYFHSGQYSLSISTYKNVIQKCGRDPYTITFLADAYTSIDSLVKARSELDSYANEYLTTSKESIYNYYRILGEINRKEGNSSAAVENQSLAVGTHEVIIGNRPLIKDLIELASLQLEAGQITVSDSLATLALSLYEEPENTDKVEANKNQVLDLWQVEAFHIKAKVAKQKYILNKSIDDLGTMAMYYDQIFDHLVKIKSAYHSMTSKYRIGEYSQSIYIDLLEFYFDRYTESNSIADYEKAFRVVQIANSFVLKEEMSLREKLMSAKIPQDSINTFLYIRSRFLSGENDVDDIKQYHSFKRRLLENHPYISNYFPDQEIGISDVRKSLLEKDLLVKYHYFEDHLYVLLLSKEEQGFHKIQLDSTNRKLIETYLQLVSSVDLKRGVSNNDRIRKLSKSVYQLILGDVLLGLKEDYKHLILVPDGPLRSLSFSALNISDDNGVDDVNNYLLSKYASSYLYFISQLNLPQKQTNGEAISFGIEYTDEYLKEILAEYNKPFSEDTDFQRTRGINLGSLAFADDEALSVAEILGGRSIVNEEATNEMLKSALQTGKLVHMSVHALVDQVDYLESVLLLNKSETESTNLSYRDIINLDLSNDLVVLSACETNLGSDIKGEGLLSISRALIQSGCKSSLGAYWSVPDQTTKDIMSLFYTNLKSGMTKSRALQQAQISYLQDDNISSPMFRSPYFWSAWVVYGADQPIYRHFSINYYFFGVGIVLVLLALFIFIKNKWRKGVTKD